MLRLAVALLLGALVAAVAAAPVQVGSKRFTESYVLGEVVTQTLQRAGIAAAHRPGLGNTAVLEQALASGAIDVYPEYSGTIVRELLGREGNPPLAELNAWLAPRGLQAVVPLGFHNGYALAMREVDAERLGLRRLSDLTQPQARALRLGLSHEFLGRADGWPGLARAYALPFASPQGLDHGLAYQALARGQVDLIDVYTTDAQLAGGGIRVLADDLSYFPRYDAVLLARIGLDTRPLEALAGRIDAARMIGMNAEAELERRPAAEVARRFLGGQAAAEPRPARRAGAGVWSRLWGDDFARLTGQHLLLVAASLLLATALGIPLGIAAWRWPALGHAVLAVVGVLQTIPSIAMLAFLIALVGGIGFVPALIALLLYALLPIVRNTLAGLQGVGAGMSQAATALGLTRGQRLAHVELPLAAPTVLAGVQTAATINVGTATLAAFIGAGGYGERIVAGLALNDTALLLAGAVPAAVLALLVQAGFTLVLRRSRAARERTATIAA